MQKGAGAVSPGATCCGETGAWGGGRGGCLPSLCVDRFRIHLGVLLFHLQIQEVMFQKQKCF